MKHKKSDYRIENTHRSLGQPTETKKTSRFQKNTMAHDIPTRVTMDDENILKMKTKRQEDKQEPITQTLEAVRKIVVDEMAKKD